MNRFFLTNSTDKTRCNQRLEAVGRRIDKDIVEAVSYSLAGQLQQAFLHGPQAHERHFRTMGCPHLPDFLLAHRCLQKGWVVLTEALHVDAYRMAADYTCHGLVAVTEAEVDVIVTLQKRLSLRGIAEQGLFVDTELVTQSPLQQQPCRQRQTLVALTLVAQGVASSLLAHLGQSLVEVEPVWMCVKIPVQLSM